jgi:hypothetical protein
MQRIGRSVETGGFRGSPLLKIADDSNSEDAWTTTPQKPAPPLAAPQLSFVSLR